MPRFLNMTRQAGGGRRWVTALIVLALTGCASLTARGRVVEVSETQLATMLGRQFPVSRRYLDVFDVVLREPQLRLMPESQRLGTRLAYTLGGPLLGTRSFDGTLELSYGLRFEPSDGSVRLTEVRLESFQVPGVPAPLQSRASRLGGLLAESLLRDAAIHRFKPEDLERARARGLQPRAVRVVPGGVQVQLEPLAHP